MKRKKVSFNINEKYYPAMVANLVTQVLQSFGQQYGLDITEVNAAFASKGGTVAVKAVETLILNAEESLRELESLCDLVGDIKDPEEDTEPKKKMSSPE
tara:strand:+ start:90 stop:386 length:297 start_codon:yes stop_codon:yes gene_type:complete